MVLKRGGAEVQVVYWRPRKYELTRFAKFGPFKENFGDMLSPLIVELMRVRMARSRVAASSATRLLAIGSVLHFARTGDVVWGSGRNGKVDEAAHRFDRLDVRSVRGPLTRDFLQARGLMVPEIYGDPGLLVRDLMPELKRPETDRDRDVIVVPNLNDSRTLGDRFGEMLVDPAAALSSVLEAISRSRVVVGSSLHAIIVADSLGIPSRLVQSPAEPLFKYDDYYLGTGRDPVEPAKSIDQALSEEPTPALVGWDSSSLMSAFPSDLWINR